MVDRKLQSLHQMEPCLSLIQVKLNAPRDDLPLVLDVMPQDLAQGQLLGNVFALVGHKRQHIGAKGILQLCMTVQLVQGHHRCRVTP